MGYSAFRKMNRVAVGTVAEVALFLKDAPQGGEFLVFDDATGQQIDLDTRGTADEISVRYSPEPSAESRGRGRPRLGVVAKEVTLLPRHWDWLNGQPAISSTKRRRS